MMKISNKYLAWTIIVCVLALAINAYIIMHSCLDATESTNASSGVVDFVENIINTIIPGTIDASNHDSFVTFIRKAFGHFGLFVISGLLTSLAIYLSINPLKKLKYWMLIVISLVFGLFIGSLTEIIQLNVPGRSGEFTDVLIDFSGYIFGFLIILLIIFLVIRSNSKKKGSSLA